MVTGSGEGEKSNGQWTMDNGQRKRRMCMREVRDYVLSYAFSRDSRSLPLVIDSAATLITGCAGGLWSSCVLAMFELDDGEEGN